MVPRIILVMPWRPGGAMILTTVLIPSPWGSHFYELNGTLSLNPFSPLAEVRAYDNCEVPRI